MSGSDRRRRVGIEQLQAELSRLTDRAELLALAEGLQSLQERANEPPAASIWEKISAALATVEAEGEAD